ncbi:MAG: glycosyltransferase, partial [Candidatus Hydrogenedentota bacterium]
STNVGGISELVIDKKTGFLLEQGDLNGFVERIKYLIQNKEIRKEMGEEAKKYIEENFQMNKVIDSYIELYKRLLDRKKEMR